MAMVGFKATDVDTKLVPFNVGPHILYANRSLEDEQLLISSLLRESKKYERGGRFKFKIHTSFCG